MKRKGWLIPIIVFFISIGCLVFYQQRQDINSLADTTTMTPILWSKASSDIVKIKYSQANNTIEAIREGSNWCITSPIKEKGDSAYIYNVIAPFTEPIFDSVVEISPSKLSAYGIDKNSPTITLYDQDNHEYIIQKGSAQDTLFTYVYTPMSDTIYTMAHNPFEAISTDITKWRSKELLSFDRQDITKVIISDGVNSYTLMPEETTINNSTKFTSSELDSNFVETFIFFLESCKIQSFITDTSDESILEAYGFNNPFAKISFYLNTGEKVSLTIGNIVKEENLCYVKLADSSSIVAIPYFDLSGLKLSSPNSN